MSYKVVESYVPSSKYKIKCPYEMTPQYITVHNTYNDASAKNEVEYMCKNNKQVSFHVAVDDSYVVLAIPFNKNAWHSGDGSSGTGNRKSIGIEICYSKSGGIKFDKAEINAAIYIANLLKQYGWNIKRVKRHKDWSGKYCPHRTMDYGWERFLSMIQSELDKLNNNSNSPVKTEINKLIVDGNWGKATTTVTQKIFNIDTTGTILHQLYSTKKYLLSCNESSWHFKDYKYKGGSTTIRKIQELVGVNIDGFCGKATVSAIQNFLKSNKFDCGKTDGYMGVKTVSAWQNYINSRLQ